MPKEYKTIREVVGPLVLVEEVAGVKYDELVKIKQSSGEERIGRVLEVNEDKALVQLFSSTHGLKIADAKAVFLGRGIEIKLSPDVLGRVFDGLGRPIDGGGEIIPERIVDINEAPLNPVARDYPRNSSKPVSAPLTG